MIATIEGRIGFFKTLNKGGLVISLVEKRINKLQKPKWHKVVVWGKKAKAMREKLKVGHIIRCSCTISTTSKGEKQYINFTIETWTKIEKSPFTFDLKVKTQRDDDWFVPEPKATSQNQHQRRYEGFQERA